MFTDTQKRTEIRRRVLTGENTGWLLLGSGNEPDQPGNGEKRENRTEQYQRGTDGEKSDDAPHPADQEAAQSAQSIRLHFESPLHTPKKLLWEVLDAENATQITLTEHMAMFPMASVSGLYFAHPESRYFSVDKIPRDQVESYAKRTGMSLQETERWLSPNLGYDPD